MILKAYSVFDHKLGLFEAPFFILADEAAMRWFKDAVQDGNVNPNWRRHPEDYSLWSIGEFDSEAGAFVPRIRINLMNGLSVQNQVPLDPPRVSDEVVRFQNEESKEKEPVE